MLCIYSEIYLRAGVDEKILSAEVEYGIEVVGGKLEENIGGDLDENWHGTRRIIYIKILANAIQSAWIFNTFIPSTAKSFKETAVDTYYDVVLASPMVQAKKWRGKNVRTIIQFQLKKNS